MKINTEKLLLNIIFIDIVLFCMGTIACSLLFSKFIYPVFIGIIVAYLNFFQERIVDYNLVQESSKNYRFKIAAGFYSRVIIAAVIPIVLFEYDINTIIAYTIGYGLHLISIAIYGINLAKFEGK